MPNQQTKLELLFIRQADNEAGFDVLGDFSVDGTGVLPLAIIPAIGEGLTVDLPGKNFGGKVVGKNITYSQKDMLGNEYVLVTRIIISLGIATPVEDAPTTGDGASPDPAAGG